MAQETDEGEGVSRQRRALAPIERLVRTLTETMGGAQQAAGPEQLQLLHTVLAKLAGEASEPEPEQQLSLPEAASTVSELLFGGLEALNAAVRAERRDKGMRDRPGAGTVPMPILGLYALEKAVELTHSLAFFPLLSGSVRRAVSFAAALSPKEGGGSSVSAASQGDRTPYGDIIVLTWGQAAAAATPGPTAGLFAAAKRTVTLLVGLTEELHPAFHSVRHIAVVYAALLELCYHPEARASPEGAAHSARCKELWAALTKALPTQLRTDALLALQASSATPSSAKDASLSSQRQVRVGKAPTWFIKAVRFQLSLTIAGEKGVASMLSAVLGTDNADDDRALSAVARLVGDYGTHHALLGQHTRRYFMAMGAQLMPLLSAGLSGKDSEESGAPAPAAPGGGAQSQEATVAAMRSGSAEAWRKAAARVAAAALQSAPPELGYDALIAPCLSPMAMVLPDVHLPPASPQPEPQADAAEPEPEPEPEVEVVVSEATLQAALTTLASLLRGSGAPRHVILSLPVSFLRLVFRLTAFASQRAPLAPVRSLGMFMLSTAFTGLGGSAEALYAMLGFTPTATDSDEADPEPEEGCLVEDEWKFGLGPGGGLCIVKCSTEEAAAPAEAEGGTETEGEDGMWEGEWMALLGGETLLAITLLENYDPAASAVGEEKEKVGAASCDAELFVLLLQHYMADDDGQTTPEQRSGKLKAGLVLEALATQRSAALCGKTSLPTLLPMLEALLRKPTDSLTASQQQQQQQQQAKPGTCQHGATAGGGFLSGESAEEERSSRNAAADAARDAIDTLQLVLGVLLAIFDPEVEQMAGAGDWGSSAIGGGASAITAAAAILRQLERLTSAAAAAREASAVEAAAAAAAAAAEQASAGADMQSGKRKHPSRKGQQRVFASSSEGLLTAAVEREVVGVAELQAAAQLATIVRMRILAALAGTSDARPDPSSTGGSDDGQPAPGTAGSIEYLSVEARHGSWVQPLPADGIVAISELSSPMPPLRAKGLAGIRALLLTRDAATMAALTDLVSVLETALEDPESFVFLAAINTVVALADVAPSQALPLLANRLSDETIGTPLRLMLTEVLEKAARGCGDVLPHYAALFVNAFLGGTASELPALRCSAISALATLCSKLGYALQKYLVDIVPTACHMLAMDAEPDVRRSAAYLLAELVAGTEETFWEILPDWLSLLYVTLKQCASGESNPYGEGDDVTRDHAVRALHVIGERTRKFLFPGGGGAAGAQEEDLLELIKKRVQEPKIIELISEDPRDTIRDKIREL